VRFVIFFAPVCVGPVLMVTDLRDLAINLFKFLEYNILAKLLDLSVSRTRKELRGREGQLR
jgi:hypothetical protein